MSASERLPNQLTSGSNIDGSDSRASKSTLGGLWLVSLMKTVNFALISCM